MQRLLIALIAISASAAAADRVSTELRAAGPWKIDYAEQVCNLSRSFSAADGEYIFALSAEPLDGQTWLRISSSDKIRKRDFGKAAVEVDGTELDEPVHFNVFANGDASAMREFLFDHRWNQVRSAVQTLRLRMNRYGDLRFHVPDIAKAMAAMDSCRDDLHRSLGIEPALLKSIVVKPEGAAGSFVRFPAGKGSLDISLLYWVTPLGRVDQCRILTTSGQPKYNAAICAELQKKGRFKPARNSTGEAVRAPVYENYRLRTTSVTSTSRIN